MSIQYKFEKVALPFSQKSVERCYVAHGDFVSKLWIPSEIVSVSAIHSHVKKKDFYIPLKERYERSLHVSENR